MPPIWKNTATLDALVPELAEPVEPARAELLVLGSKPVDLTDFPAARGLFKCGVGVDNVPFEACAARGIAVGLPGEGTREVIFDETANFATHLILQMAYAEVGDLAAWQKFPRSRLNDRTALLLGVGNIGTRVRERLRPMMRVVSYDAREDSPTSLEPRMREADVVSIHLPLTEATRGFLDGTRLGWLRDGAAVVNTARGPVVDEQALLAEVQRGRLRAAFDVFWKEPYYGPLRAFHPHHFFMTPHVASTCTAFVEGLAADFRAFAADLG